MVRLRHEARRQYCGEQCCLGGLSASHACSACWLLALPPPTLLSPGPHLPGPSFRAVVNFYTGLGYAADPEGIKGMFWHPRF